MYLSKITLNNSYVAKKWASNPYRVHQRICMACNHDPRVLFRMEQSDGALVILVQSHTKPDWEKTFADLRVLAKMVEYKSFELHLQPACILQFKLAANPTVKRNGKRLGLLKEEEQLTWLKRKFTAVGAHLHACRVIGSGFQRSRRTDEEYEQIHWLVLYEGLLQVTDPQAFEAAVAEGIGPAKGFGCGLLSLAQAK